MRHVVWGLLLVAAGCTSRLGASAGPPALVLGTFVDDYGIAYTITAQTWHQQPDARYHVVRWDPEAGYLLAQNDAANPTDGGLWTRIDWVRLDGVAPYAWAFCLSVYDAPSAEAAEAAAIARKETPRTGCNGYPFSRMRRVETLPDSLRDGYGG